MVDIPRGEFWNGSQFWVVKEVASAAHIYGRQIVDAESFTGWRHWQDGPLEYKRLADTAFCDGLNRITFHTFAHTPPQGGVPGNMYHAGEHFNVNSTWWPKAAPMLSYFSRCCYLLQQGLPVADVCFYYGDDAPNLVATRRIGPDSKRLDGATCAHCGRPNPAPADALGTGYDYDVINSDVIENRMEFKDGRLTLPHGVSYEVIVLPERTDIPLPVLAKLETLVRDGATLLGPKPERDTSLADYPRCDEQVKTIAERIWGSGKGGETSERSYGKGRVIADRKRVRDILQQRGIGPDFAYSSPGKPADLDYIHRRTPDADIYFVSNTQMEDAEADCTFRVPPRLPQLWYPDTGEIKPCTDYARVPGGMKLKLRLPPAGSVFVVFSGTAPEAAPTPVAKEDGKPPAPLEITGPWEVRFPPNLGAPPSRVFDKLVSWTTIPDDGIKYFSGTATYLKEFEVPASMLADGSPAGTGLGTTPQRRRRDVEWQAARDSLEAALRLRRHRPGPQRQERIEDRNHQPLGQPPGRRRETSQGKTRDAHYPESAHRRPPRIRPPRPGAITFLRKYEMRMRNTGELPDDAAKGLEVKFAQKISHRKTKMNTKTTRAIVGAVVAMSLVANAVMAQQAGAGKPRQEFKGPVKVFILAGQSNMEGHAGVQNARPAG